MAYRGLGNFYLKNQQFDKSEENYTNAIKINDNRFGPIYKNRGYVRQQQNKIEQAKEEKNNTVKMLITFHLMHVLSFHDLLRLV